MEEFKNKTFLLKIRSDLFDYLTQQNEHEKAGKLKVFLNKKTNRPEYIFQFNKEKEPKKFSLVFDKTENFIYFEDKEKDGKISGVDYFGNLIISDEDKANEFVKNIYAKENDKSKEIQIKEVKDREVKYVKHEEISLIGKPMSKDRKDKKVRIDDEELIEYVKKEVKNKETVTPGEISDKYSVPEDQVKKIMEKICDKIPGKKRKFLYKLKDDFDE